MISSHNLNWRWLSLATAACLLVSQRCTAQSSGAGLLLDPQHLVFSVTAGQPCLTVQTLRIVVAGSTPAGTLTWTRTSSSSWVSVQPSGSIPETANVSVNASGLSPGVYQGTLTLSAAGLNNSPQTVRVDLIVNPSTRLRVSPWKDGRKGALSVSVDDGMPSGFELLQERGLGGTYLLNGADVPSYFAGFSQSGMEFGSHLLYHWCTQLSEGTLRQYIEANLAGLGAVQPASQLVSLAWPCGEFNVLSEQVIAAEYFLAARGYDVNALEDPTPANFMYLKCYNSREHDPYPPADLKSVVDAAEVQGKWAHLVFHNQFRDDDAVRYATGKDLWMAPVGRVVKYILQRDRVVISRYSEDSSTIEFDYHRLALDSSPRRTFETAITAEDTVTFQLDLTDRPGVTGVLAGGSPAAHRLAEIGGKKLLFLNLAATPAKQTVRVLLAASVQPTLAPLVARLSFSSVESSDPPPQTIQVINQTSAGTLAWSASVDAEASHWLAVQPSSGVGNATLTVRPAAAHLSPGRYAGQVTVAAPGIANSPQKVTVILKVTAAETVRYDFNYPNRASLLNAGWSFLGRTAAGATRNTEFNSAASVSFDQVVHPGTLRIQVNDGDLWRNSNNSQNNLFRDLPPLWTSVRLKASFAPTASWQQAGLAVYQDDDHFVRLNRSFGNYGDELSQPAGVVPTYFLNNRVALDYETAAQGTLCCSAAFPATTFYLRIDRGGAPDTYRGYYSLDGFQWILLGQVTQKLINPRVCVFNGGTKPDVYPKPFLDVEWVEVTTAGLANGSFENNQANWTATGNLGVASGSPYQASAGAKLIAFNWGQTTPNGMISQSFPTIQGHDYRLDFDLGVLGYNFNQERLKVTVQGASTLLSQTLSIWGNGNGTAVWVPQSFSFKADSASTTLTFQDVSLNTVNIDLLLDNVRVAGTSQATKGLTVQSVNPDSGVAISVSPSDISGQGNGTTAFTRTYAAGMTVTVTAPATAGGKSFQKWQINGVDYTASPATTVTLNADYTLRAVYTTPNRIVTVQSVNPDNGVAISVSPSDINRQGAGSTAFTRTYPDGITVTVTAPATVGGNSFQKWQINGADYTASPTTTVTLNADYTLRAVYTAPYRILTVQSVNPESGVAVTVSASDTGGQGNGTTAFTRTYAAGTTVTVTAPASVAGNSFQKWQANGVDYTASPAITLALNADCTLRAVYTTPYRILTVQSVNPDSGVAVTVSPSDSSGQGSGTTAFTRTYAAGTTVTVTAPATVGGNSFQKWQANGVDYTSSPATTVTLNADYTLRAVYGSAGVISLLNGSFESDYTGWAASGNQGIASGAPYQASHGTKMVAFNWGQTTPDGVLSQTVATLRGQPYTLSFDLGVLAYNFDKQQLRVTVKGSSTLLSPTLSIFGTGNGLMKWVPQSLTFTADSAATTVTFEDLSPHTANVDLLLDNVRLVAQDAPAITGQPASATIGVGESVTFTAVANGQNPLAYQWRFNGTPIPGATTSSYTVNNAQASQAGEYRVIVSNGSGSATSAPATLTVLQAVAFTNGSFESGLAGWSASGNLGAASGAPYQPTDGVKMLAFNWGQTTPDGVVSQTFATAVGQKLRLRFDWGIFAYNRDEQRLRVTVRGVASTLFTDILADIGLGNGNTLWTAESLTFTANSTVTTLTFEDVSPNTINVDLLLDNVRVEPVATGSSSASGRFESTRAGLQSQAAGWMSLSRTERGWMLHLCCPQAGIFVVERSDDLKAWRRIGTVQLAAEDEVEVEEMELESPARFYRISPRESSAR